MPTSLRVLITRPEKQGQQLQHSLNEVGIYSLCQPLFYYQQNPHFIDNQRRLNITTLDIIIFVSEAAVEYAHNALPSEQWMNKRQKIIAVGAKTQSALAKLGYKSTCPLVQSSEGILALPMLDEKLLKKSSSSEKILIVRGNGGRELLAEQLKNRGATVQYIESYRRIWPAFNQRQLAQWQEKKINTIIITSNALLKRVVNLIDIKDNYWQNTCLWVVASQRIAKSAHKIGLRNIVNANGASSQSIVTTLLKMESKND